MVKILDDEASLAAHVRDVGEGELIYQPGEPGGDLFVVQRGRVQLSAASGVAVCEVGAGDIFGELGALAEGGRESGARALEPTSLLRIDRPTLEALLRQRPELALALLSRVARRAAALLAIAAAPPPPVATSVPAEEPAPSPKGRPRLSDASGVEFLIPAGDEIVVGRRSGQVVPDIDLTPVDTERSLSRRHARIVRSGAMFGLREEPGVLNGTFLNGVRLKAGESPRLRDGDEIGLGLVKLRFRE